MSALSGGRLQTAQEGPAGNGAKTFQEGAETYFEVKLATEPQNGSLVAQ